MPTGACEDCKAPNASFGLLAHPYKRAWYQNCAPPAAVHHREFKEHRDNSSKAVKKRKGDQEGVTEKEAYRLGPRICSYDWMRQGASETLMACFFIYHTGTISWEPILQQPQQHAPAIPWRQQCLIVRTACSSRPVLVCCPVPAPSQQGAVLPQQPRLHPAVGF
jgi:hypothetical protein